MFDFIFFTKIMFGNWLSRKLNLRANGESVAKEAMEEKICRNPIRMNNKRLLDWTETTCTTNCWWVAQMACR